MDSVGTTESGTRPGGSQRPARAGQSGEGAGSALEQLIQQERKRESQRPREAVAEDRPERSAP